MFKNRKHFNNCLGGSMTSLKTKSLKLLTFSSQTSIKLTLIPIIYKSIDLEFLSWLSIWKFQTLIKNTYKLINHFIFYILWVNFKLNMTNFQFGEQNIIFFFYVFTFIFIYTHSHSSINSFILTILLLVESELIPHTPSNLK